MEHLKLFWSRINIPKVIKSTEQAHLWSELVFLYVKYDEFDNAALAMMERSSSAWDHSQFKDVVVKVANVEIYYKVCMLNLSSRPWLTFPFRRSLSISRKLPLSLTTYYQLLHRVSIMLVLCGCSRGKKWITFL